MAKGQGKVGEGATDLVRQIPLACADEDEAVRFMEAQRWGEDPFCPRQGCGSTDVYRMKGEKAHRRHLWRCRSCKRQFTVKVGTIMEDSPIPLRHWCYAFWAACASKKGVSSLQIQRMTGLSYKSALFMMHRIRWAMADHGPNEMMDGIVEVDEAWVGGKPRPRGKKARQFMSQKENADSTGRQQPKIHYTKRKAPVVALVNRGGRAKMMAVANVTADTLKDAVRDSVTRGSRIMTDELMPYQGLGKEFAAHETVNHSQNEYHRGDVGINQAESLFALLKRSVYGTFHNISRAHLHRYASEVEFKWNTRKMDDGARTVAAIKGAEGKRLTYRNPRDR